MVFERTKTLIIPTSNDLVDDGYLHRKFDFSDNLSRYRAAELREVKRKKLTEIEVLKNRLLNVEDLTVTDIVQMRKDLKKMEDEIEQSDQLWNITKYSQKHRERTTIAKVINAFANADIGGILILSPKQNKEFENFIKKECKKYPEFKDFPKEFKQYPEICDCIFIHPILGIYTIEVKSADKIEAVIFPDMTLITREQSNISPYEKAVFQVARMLTPTSNESMSLLQQLYALITGSSNFIPRMSGIVCTPNAKYENVEYPEYLDQQYHLFDHNLITSIDEFNQFWAIEISKYNSIDAKNLFEDPSYRKFIATMANCSVGRELFGINNSLMIAKKITEQNIDPTMMEKRQYISSEGSQTIFLNAKQLQILNDTSKLKLIFGPPGTGKTLLLILAAIEAVNEENKKVFVFTANHLVEYMKRIFKMNRFDENTIEVRDFTDGIEKLNVNDYIFVDECTAEESEVQKWLNIAKLIRNVKLFVAITGQVNIDELCSIKEQIMQLLKNTKDCRIFQLTEILRGTKSIIDFWINRLNQILPKKLQMECGHSIVGENVHYYSQYMKSDDIVEKMVERLKELLRNNEPKNVAIICDDSYEKQIIENRLKLIKIAFGSTIEQDNNHSLIAVESSDNIYSREWPFVIYVDLLPYSQHISIISSSRAIAHLTLIERNVKEIRKIIRDKCDKKMIKTILSSFDKYKQFRNQIQLSDDKNIMYHDLFIDIISFNYFPSQIKQFYPNIFDDCNTFDQFFDIIVNKEQWMLLLFVHQLKYFQEYRHMDKSINLIIVYKQSTEWIESHDIEEIRSECLINNAKKFIELINKFIQPQVMEMMEKVVTNNKLLFAIFNNSNCQHQFYLLTNSIRHIILTNCVNKQQTQKVKIDKNEIDHLISKLLLNLKQQQPQPSTTATVINGRSDAENALLASWRGIALKSAISGDREKALAMQQLDATLLEAFRSSSLPGRLGS